MCLIVEFRVHRSYVLPSLPPSRGLYTGPRFYDIWVARDVEGERFQEDPPFFLHPPPPLSPEGGKEEGGKEGGREGGPFPVYCCWNGMVAMEAEPFYR